MQVVIQYLRAHRDFLFKGHYIAAATRRLLMDMSLHIAKPPTAILWIVASFQKGRWNLSMLKGEVQSRITIISKERVKISLQIGANMMKIG